MLAELNLLHKNMQAFGYLASNARLWKIYILAIEDYDCELLRGKIHTARQFGLPHALFLAS